MIDEILNGNGWKYISKEVQEDYPEATDTAPLTTPSIYMMADVISEYVIKIDKELILDKKYTCYKDTNGEGNATLEITILEKLENNEYKVNTFHTKHTFNREKK